jgi:tRNA pseudouridine55 synthase
VKRERRPIDGWLAIDKPAGITSAGVVARLKHRFDARRVGHGGTLDPIATGVLPIAFGAATKTVAYVMDGTKIYRFTLRLGQSRTTDDIEGDVLAETDARPSDDALRQAAAGLTGSIMQVPPIYSALKVAGERAYDLARSGRIDTLPPRPARVDRFTLLERPDADHAIFEVQSGKGVYMRSLARDVARAAGAVGHIAALRRLRVGPFAEAATICLDIPALNAENAPASPDLLLPIATALADIPALALTGEEAERLSNGRTIDIGLDDRRAPGLPDDRPVLVRAMAGERVLGLCRLHVGRLIPERILQPLTNGDR